HDGRPRRCASSFPSSSAVNILESALLPISKPCQHLFAPYSARISLSYEWRPNSSRCSTNQDQPAGDHESRARYSVADSLCRGCHFRDSWIDLRNHGNETSEELRWFAEKPMARFRWI